MTKLFSKNSQKGQSIVELLIVIGLSAIMLPTIFMSIIASSEGNIQERERMKATPLIREAQDIVRNIRDNSWYTIAGYTLDTTYHPSLDGTGKQWQLTPGTDTINEFTRSIIFSSVFRDTNGLATTSGTLDPSTILVTTTISWTAKYPSSITAKMYLTHHDNNDYTQTSQVEFNAGSLIQSQTTNTLGGEVILGYNNRAKWCSPTFTKDSNGNEITIDLPDGPPVAVVATASASIDYPNDVFVATAPYATSSVKLAYVTVTANQSTPSASLRGTFTLDPAKYSNAGLVPSGIGIDNNFITNDVKYYKSPSGKLYALLATNLSDHEVIAVQINNGSGDAWQDATNKIYKYWTYFNTKIYNAAFNNPTAQAAETSNAGDNNGYEGTPTNAYLNDGTFTTDTNSGNNTGTNCTGTDKDKHRYYNYDFSIPTGATINGIETNLVAKVNGTTGTPKICVQLSWDGGTTWTTAKTGNNLTTSSATYVYGGATDNWGRTWTDTNFSNANFRVRIIDIASNTTTKFSLDWVGVKVYYNGISTMANDQEPFGYGARSIAVSGSTGYVISGGYLYTFDLSNIDTKNASTPLDQIGCRIQLDGYDCSPGTGTDKKYDPGETGSNWSDTTTPAHNDCSDGGNIELYADNHIYPVSVGGNKYVYVAVGAGTNPEFEIVNVTNVPDAGTTPAISSNTCGRISGGAAGWHVISSLDFNPNSGTEEAANSIYASLDGTRAYISSNGGIDGNNDGIPDSDQFYILNTSNKSTPTFLTSWSSNGTGHQANTASSGYYNGNTQNIQMHPRRSLTVLDGKRVVLVGKDATADGNNAQEYQVLNNDTEATPNFCGGVDFNPGFNDLTSVSESDGDNFVYMVANTNQKQLKIIEGGPDVGLYFDSGTIDSTASDSGKLTTYNSFFASETVNPPTTDIQFQVAVAGDAGANCASATYKFVGPDGTEATKFATSSGSIPLSGPTGYQNPGRCFKYRAYLTTQDTNQTPTLKDFNINFSQ
jgi:type II secretory pathway pseudopilin PulG